MPRLLLSAAFLMSTAAAPLVFADEPGPAPAPAAQTATAEQILGWVGDLGSDDFRRREEAQVHLGRVGEAAREALESAAKTSDSLEVRWRAQQLLLRLDGRRERPLGGPEQEPRPDAVLPGHDDLRKLFEADTPEEMRELMDKLMRDFGRRGAGSGLQIAPLQGMDVFGTNLVSGDLTLRLSPFGRTRAELIVRGQDAAGMPSLKTYGGADLDAILEANPTLKDHPALPGLREQVESSKRRGNLRRLDPTLRVPMFSFSTSEGVEIQQDGAGVTVRVRQKGADGRIETKEYKGASLEEIKKEHPELAGRLGGFQVRIAPPRVFRGPKEEPLPSLPEPLPLPQERVPTSESEPSFGVVLEPVDGLLSRHLRLEPGQSVLVRRIVRGSLAAALGLEEFDVIESIDGRAVVSLADAVVRLRAAVKTSFPLSLGILRSGQRQTLSR